jgi:hypothetical protein
MKNIHLSKYLIAALWAIMSAFGLISCTEDLGWNVDPAYDRLFRTLSFDTDSLKATSVILRWQSMPLTDHYVVEISKDSLEFNTIIKTYDSITTDSVLVKDLMGNARYSARIKGVSTKQGKGESEYVSMTFKTKAEQIMSPLTQDDISFTTVKLSWVPNSTITHLLLTPQNADTLQPVKLIPTDVEKQAGKMTVTGLTAGVTYNVGIYNTDENLRGSLVFRTNELQSIGQIIEVQEGDSIHLKLAQATSNAVTLIFKQGTYYQNNTSITIKDGMSVLFYGMPGSSLPTLSLNSITLSANHGTIRFENINLTGQYKNADGTLATSQRDYLFNQGTVTNVNNLEFKSCYFHNFNRNLVRLKDAGDQKTINNLKIDGCVMYEQGSGAYPLIGCTIANGLINNISINNSTFYRILNNFIQHSVSNPSSIVISNSTFNNIVGAGKYFIDCSASYGPTGQFLISNCIFGKSFDATTKGVRANKAITVTNSYKTSDWVVGSNAIPSLTDFAGASTDLFSDPNNGNFTIKTSSFAGAKDTGDPRWRITE